MEFIIDVFKYLAHVYKEVFWLKELLTTLQSLVVFILVRWFVSLKHRVVLLLFLSAFIGCACSFFGDLGYWNDNDVLKHIAPASLYLVRNNKDFKHNIPLFVFLAPFFIISYEFYRSIFIAILSILSHLLIISFIVVAKNNIYLTLLISIIVGLLYNYIGDIGSPSTNDIFINPVLTTLSIKYIGFYTEDNRYTIFLKYFWIVLLCFAYFGSWIFQYLSDYYDK